MTATRFRQDGTFTIAQFTDMHIINYDENDEQTLRLCDRVVEAEKPDLIVVSGDVIHTNREKAPDVPALWRRLVAHFDGYGLPWAFLFGNHDAELITYEEVAEILQTSTNGLFEPGPAEIAGWSNYAVKIERSDSDEVGAVVFCHDSGRTNDGDLSGWGYVHADQVEWLRESASELLSDDTVTGLLYVHNPLPQYDEAWKKLPALGSAHESVCFQGKDTGTFDVMRETGLSGVFCGHDHINDYDVEMDGVHLIFGRYTGINAYGKEGFPRGSRIVKLREGVRGFESHIRLEDGTIAEQPTHQPTGDPPPQV